jgi:hypothetical protein
MDGSPDSIGKTWMMLGLISRIACSVIRDGSAKCLSGMNAMFQDRTLRAASRKRCVGRIPEGAPTHTQVCVTPGNEIPSAVNHESDPRAI